MESSILSRERKSAAIDQVVTTEEKEKGKRERERKNDLGGCKKGGRMIYSSWFIARRRQKERERRLQAPGIERSTGPGANKLQRPGSKKRERGNRQLSSRAF